MAKVPSTIIRLGAAFAVDGKLKLKQLQNLFYLNGYGIEKTMKWIEHFRTMGIIDIELIDDVEYASCVWWKKKYV